MTLRSFEFMATTATEGGKRVDLRSMTGAYDCGVTHRWRALERSGYVLGQAAAAFDVKGATAWAIGAPESNVSALWERACRPRASEFQPLPEDMSTQAGREAAVLGFRSIVDLL